MGARYTDTLINDGLNTMLRIKLLAGVGRLRSDTNGLNEELLHVCGCRGGGGGEHSDRQCRLCGDECESVVHVLWECPV